MNKKVISLTIICLLLAIVNGYIFNYINNKYFHLASNENGLDDYPKIGKIIIIIIIAPIIETVLCQVLPFSILSALKVVNKLLLILIPSLIFASMHHYHWLYMLMTFFGGLILNYYYYCVVQIHSEYAFALTAILHATYNLYGFLFIV
ncbi:MAG: hypothetical protein RLZZ628_1641 [Bacteroidota bacterium]|jgi:membrane protease YdiL (CAAX protease family)